MGGGKITSSDRLQRILSNRAVWAAAAGALVWFADQPTVDGYHPLFEMLWRPGVWNLPYWDGTVLVLSWFVTTLFCHFLFFTVQRLRDRDLQR
ncbi:MAG: hypothetical protein JWO48_472 [Bryobacterales bacterium]|nr:hypothetical protein [Bryobacterales bacterium]